jgi:hypothetical protein
VKCWEAETLSGHFQDTVPEPSVCLVDYRDGTKAAVYSVRGVGWTYAGEIEGREEPTIVSMLGWPGPYSQYHAANAVEHWIIEMMLTRKEPVNAERLLLSTGDCVVQHGIKLGERPLLSRRTPGQDALHGHDLQIDTRTDV